MHLNDHRKFLQGTEQQSTFLFLAQYACMFVCTIARYFLFFFFCLVGGGLGVVLVPYNQFKSIAELQGFMWLVWETRFRVVARASSVEQGWVSVHWVGPCGWLTGGQWAEKVHVRLTGVMLQAQSR